MTNGTVEAILEVAVVGTKSQIVIPRQMRGKLNLKEDYYIRFNGKSLTDVQAEGVIR